MITDAIEDHEDHEEREAYDQGMSIRIPTTIISPLIITALFCRLPEWATGRLWWRRSRWRRRLWRWRRRFRWRRRLWWWRLVELSLQLHRMVPLSGHVSQAVPSLYFWFACIFLLCRVASVFRLEFKYFRYRVMIGSCSMYHWPEYLLFRLQMEMVASTFPTQRVVPSESMLSVPLWRASSSLARLWLKRPMPRMSAGPEAR